MNFRKLSRRNFFQLVGFGYLFLGIGRFRQRPALPLPTKPISPTINISELIVSIGSSVELKMKVTGDWDRSQSSFPLSFIDLHTIGAWGGGQAEYQGWTEVRIHYEASGEALVYAVVDYFRVKRKLRVTTFMAECAIREIGSALPLESRRSMLVRGTSLTNGLHTEVEITDTEIRKAMKDALSRIVRPIAVTINGILNDLTDGAPIRNVVLTGDFAQLKMLDQQLQELIGFDVVVQPSEMPFGFQAHNQHGIVLSRVYSVVSLELCDAVVAYLREEHQLLIGDRMAEHGILDIGFVLPSEPGFMRVVRGRSLIDGSPAELEITSSEIRQAIADEVSRIVSTIAEDIRSIPEDLLNGAPVSSIVLTGTWGQLPTFDERLQEATGLKVSVAQSEHRARVTRLLTA